MSTTEKLAAALEALLKRDQRNTCQHDETHRGGAIWTICDGCGRKWADDEGGKPRWKDPAEWDSAEKALVAYRAQPAADGAQRVRQESSFPMGDGWAVTVSRWNEQLLTISSEHLAGKLELTDEDERVILGCSEHLAAFLGAPAHEAQRVDRMSEEQIDALWIEHGIGEDDPGAFARAVETHLAAAWGVKLDGDG